ncbi:hypothetical protein AG1IA_09184 [Rhizoctonia solani AG-1 IA]|uniref:Uncharacterized protein n=1 Tax=Thanatephorus cucumeris (strain AG1-IA) TaxID=983506 RepID=L8WF50_THACA|nr:hypothetical protein AG1IA_09184 [Rhizoctonia solani AG-1 IA]
MSTLGALWRYLELHSVLEDDLESLMGQISSNNTFSFNENIKPGTYRIIHSESGKTLQISDNDEQALITCRRRNSDSNRPGTKKDHWFLQRSGGGYIFKNCLHGTYMSIALGSGFPYDIRATPYPATWVIYSEEGPSPHCVITTDQTASTVLYTHSESKSSEAGNAPVHQKFGKLYLAPRLDGDEKLWKLERIGHATGQTDVAEQASQLARQLEETKSELSQANERLSKNASELDRLWTQVGVADVETCQAESELHQTQTELPEREKELTAPKKGLISKEEALARKIEALAEKEKELVDGKEALVAKDKELSINQEKLASAQKMVDEMELKLAGALQRLKEKEEILQKHKELCEKNHTIPEKDQLLHTEGVPERPKADNGMKLGQDEDPVEETIPELRGGSTNNAARLNGMDQLSELGSLFCAELVSSAGSVLSVESVFGGESISSEGSFNKERAKFAPAGALTGVDHKLASMGQWNTNEFSISAQSWGQESHHSDCGTSDSTRRGVEPTRHITNLGVHVIVARRVPRRVLRTWQPRGRVVRHRISPLPPPRIIQSIQGTMGQKPSHHAPDLDIKLGTYFIIHDCSGKAIQIDSQNYQKITVWDRHAGDNQQVCTPLVDPILCERQSGKGYMFKNKQHGYYLGMSLSDDSPFPVCATPYPCSWVVMKQDQLAIGDGCPRIVACDEIKSRVLSLDSGVLSIGENGDKVCSSKALIIRITQEVFKQVRATRYYASADESWRLERLSDETGEELPKQYQIERAQLQRDLAEKVQELLRKDRKLARRGEELARKDADITMLKADLHTKDRGIRSRDQEIVTKQQELARKEQELAMKDREILAKMEEIAELKSLKPRKSIIQRLLRMEAEVRSKSGRSRTSSVAPPISVSYGSEFDFRSEQLELRSQYSEDDQEDPVLDDSEMAALYARAEKLENRLSKASTTI